MFLNLLFKSMRSDPNPKRVRAFIKRLAQTAALHQAPFVCGALYLINQLFDTIPGLTSSISQPEEEEDEDEETFADVPDEGFAIASRLGKAQSVAVKGILNQSHKYDGRRRDPEHSDADKSCLWEMVCAIPNALQLHSAYIIHRRRY